MTLTLDQFLGVFRDFMKENNFRNTVTKEKIVTAIFNHDHHFEIDELLAQLNQTGHSFSRATFYRTIKQLSAGNFIQKVMNVDGRMLYEVRDPDVDHDHVICNKCGKITEVMDVGINKAIQQFCKTHSFESIYRSLHIYVECGMCKTEA